MVLPLVLGQIDLESVTRDFETFYASVGALYWILDTTIDPADFVTDKSAGSVLFPPSRNLSLQVPSQSIEKLNTGCLRISILRQIENLFGLYRGQVAWRSFECGLKKKRLRDVDRRHVVDVDWDRSCSL